MTKPQAILLIGPTGSGKTPLGELLESRGLWGRRCHHLDFGQQLRQAADGPTAPPLTPADLRVIRRALRAGALLEDEQFPIAEKILLRFLAARRVDRGDLLVLNGLPRHTGQARDVAAIVEVRAVVELSCSPQAARERIRTDTGGDRPRRTDDTPPAVRSRLRTYRQRTAPLLRHYRAGGVRTDRLPVGPDTTADQLRDALEAFASAAREE